MKVGLFTKLFSASLLTATLVVLSMMLSVHWTFQHGLKDYLRQKELKRLTKLIPLLEDAYAKTGSWDSYRNDPETLYRLLRKVFKDDAPPHFGGFGPPPPRPPGPPSPPDSPPPDFPFPQGPDQSPPPDCVEVSPELLEVLPFESVAFLPGLSIPPFDCQETFEEKISRPPRSSRGRGPPGPHFRLFDEQKRLVVGPPHHPLGLSPAELLQPVTHQGKIVGWIELHLDGFMMDQLAINFQTSQFNNYSLIALLMVIISAVVSLKLVQQLLNPIQKITHGVHALTHGVYQTRVQVKSQDELGQLARDFNQLAHTLERNEQVRRQWVADISHELRTPLAILQGEIEAIQDGIWSTSPEVLKSLHNEVLGLSKLVEDLYSLALSDLGALDYRKEQLNIIEVLSEIVELFFPRFAAKDIKLEMITSETEIDLLADARRLVQLFTNLLENGLRYTDSGGQLEIHVSKASKTVIVDFLDSAPGVPEEALSKLFERLYRVDKSRSRALGGAGLGLAICYNIVEAHEGQISAHHSPLGGVGIKVELPLYGTE